MRQKSKRLFAGILALSFALSAWKNAGFFSLAAERASVTKMWAASVREVGEVPQLWPGLQHKKVQYAMIDGETAYCMNFGLRGYKGLAVTGSEQRMTALSAEQEKRLLYCLYYGFAAETEGEPNREEACAYIATQALLWNITSGIFGSGTDDEAARLVCASAPDPDQAFSNYVSLKGQVKQACDQKLPDFATKEAEKAPVYELCWNSGNRRYELTLEDKNGMLDDYELSLSGYEILREKNQITIYTQKAHTEPTLARLQAQPANVEITDSCVYWLTGLEGYQEFVTEKPSGSPNDGFFRVRTESLGTITICKTDRETGMAVPQGDAVLSGAVYGLYAREDVYRGADILYRPGELVTTLTTDENGRAGVEELHPGKYYLKELTAPKGYVPDETEYEVVLDDQGKPRPEIRVEVTVSDQVKKQPFRLIKIADDGQATEGTPLAGAGFRAYLKSSLPVKADGSYDFEAATPVVLGADGATIIYTDEKGQAVSAALPYGVYVVVEAVTPHNMKPIRPFEVTIDAHHPTEPQQWRVFLDRSFRAKLRIVKKDSDTGRTVRISGAEFKIFNLDTGAYVVQYTTYPSKVEHTSFFTDKDGDLILPEALPVGRYRIEEVTAPAGYVKNQDAVLVTVDTDTAYRMDEDTQDAVIEAEYVNAPAVGRLRIEKRGEELMEFGVGTPAGAEVLEKRFLFREMPLAGAKFMIFAAEDIYTADGQTDENGMRTCYYRKGDLVETLVTGTDGQAVTKDLPLGAYRVVETEVPYGYVAEECEQLVTLSYADDETSVIYENRTVHNAYQKARVSVKKIDAEDGKALAGAILGLYAAEDILTNDGTAIVKKSTELAQAVTGEDGNGTFALLLPPGSYYVKELQAPAGYEKSDETIPVAVTYQAEGEAILELQTEFVNVPVKEPPKTGDEAAPWLYAGMCFSSAVWLAVSGWRRRRRKNL